jgi:hypothetical protein
MRSGRWPPVKRGKQALAVCFSSRPFDELISSSRASCKWAAPPLLAAWISRGYEPDTASASGVVRPQSRRGGSVGPKPQRKQAALVDGMQSIDKHLSAAQRKSSRDATVAKPRHNVGFRNACQDSLGQPFCQLADYASEINLAFAEKPLTSSCIRAGTLPLDFPYRRLNQSVGTRSGLGRKCRSQRAPCRLFGIPSTLGVTLECL